MHLTVLGCQAGVPRRGRASSGYLVSDADTAVLLDCGPGVATALSGLGVRPSAVVLSHLHLDHCHDLLPLAKQLLVEQLAAIDPSRWAGVRGPDLALPRVSLFVPEGANATLDVWEALFPVPSLPVLDRPFAHAFDVREYRPGDTAQIGAFDLTLHAMTHAVPTCGVRLDGPAGSMAFTGDTGACAALVPLARDVDLLLAEATLAAPDPTAHGHLCAADAARAATAAGARQLVLTHLPDGAATTVDARRADARRHFTGPVHVAEPGLVLPVRPPVREASPK